MHINRAKAKDFLARAIVALLFVLLSANLLAEFIQTHHVTGLMLLVNEALVAILTILHRPALSVDRSAKAGLVTLVSVTGPVLLRTGAADALAPDALTALVSLSGLAIVIAAKLTLGRSFGLVPANRGVVAQGPYQIVRHPIYAGYLITHVAFLLAHPDAMNIALVALADSALVIRALLEERVLEHDEQYRVYCSRVGWHLVPGVF
jgi:protein-S-isoprenylcysteine O-methyltransferase Ste14